MRRRYKAETKRDRRWRIMTFAQPYANSYVKAKVVPTLAVVFVDSSRARAFENLGILEDLRCMYACVDFFDTLFSIPPRSAPMQSVSIVHRRLVCCNIFIFLFLLLFISSLTGNFFFFILIYFLKILMHTLLGIIIFRFDYNLYLIVNVI